MFDARLM